MASETATRRLIILIIIVLVIITIVILVFALLYKAASSSSTTSTGCSNLPPPTNLSAVSVGLTRIRVTFNAVANAARYHIYIGSISGFDKATAFNDYFTGDTQYDIEGMVLGRTYYIRVATVNDCSGEGILSAEKSATLGYPPKFRIISREQPTLALTVAPDFNNIVVDGFCSGDPGDDLCIWSYDSDTGYMTTANAPLNCMKTYPASVDYRVKYEPCGAMTYYNFAAARQWNYNTDVGSLCNPQNSEGLNCVKISGTATPGQFTVRTPYDGDIDMQWDILEA